MKTLTCEVCDENKPVSELKRGRYCCIVVCDDCITSAEPSEEEWTPIKVDTSIDN